MIIFLITVIILVSVVIVVVSIFNTKKKVQKTPNGKVRVYRSHNDYVDYDSVSHYYVSPDFNTNDTIHSVDSFEFGGGDSGGAGAGGSWGDSGGDSGGGDSGGGDGGGGD